MSPLRLLLASFLLVSASAGWADDPDPGTVAFAGAVMFANEPGVTGTVLVPMVRSGGSQGSVSVTVNSAHGTTTAADFVALENVVITFEHGETQKGVPVTITADATQKEPNETFTLTLSAPTGGATLGTPNPATVRIVDAYDVANPTLTVLTPSASAIVLENVNSLVRVSGKAADNQGIALVEVALDSGGYAPSGMTLAADGKSATFALNVVVTPGVHTFSVRCMDTRGRFSAVVKRPFTYRVVKPLSAAILPADSGTVTAGYVPNSNRYAGIPYTITATPKAGYVFKGWTANDFTGTGVSDAAKELPALTFTMQSGLALTANFLLNPFVPSVAGTYNGLVIPSETLPEGGTAPSVATVGHLTATVGTTGSFTATLKIDGASLALTGGKFDNLGVARFGKTRATSLTLKRTGKPDLEVALTLNMTPGTGKLTGSVTQKLAGITQAVSEVDADRAHYSSKSKVPATFAGTVSQRYNVIFPTEAQTGLTTDKYPQGTGIGSIIVKTDGGVAFAGTLADNTTFTASTTLSQNQKCPFFVQLYTLKGSIAGQVTVDPTQDATDAVATDCLWFRPNLPTAAVQWYRNGWPSGITVDLLGAKFIVPPTTPATSVIPGLGTTSPNATLSFAEGLLGGPINKNVNISPANAVTEVPADASYTLTLTKTTGEIGGSFTHTDGKKPTYKATTIQKAGVHRGTWGFFLTAPTAPLNHLGQSGRVTLLPK